jgi:hypothetical protein
MRPDLVSSLVVAEANLDPGIGPFSARILAVSEDQYVRTGFESALKQARDDARNDPESPSAITVGMQAVASPRAMHRTARSLTEERRPTFRELLVELGMPRSFVVGANTLDQHERPASGEDGKGLEDLGNPASGRA